MPDTCAVCGKKLGGLLGLVTADEAVVQDLRARGYEVPSPICYACSRPYVDKAAQEEAEREGRGKEYTVPDIPVFTYNPFTESSAYKNAGLVTAHVVLGTGPFPAVVSGLTDFFGEQSEAYDKKMRQATQACLDKLKINAVAIGAESVIGVQITYTELTAGHGMIMVCMSGTGIKEHPASSR